MRAGVARRDGSLQRIRTARGAERLGPVERGETAADQELIPASAVLIEQQDGLSRRTGARAQARENATPESPSARLGHEPRALWA